MAGSAKAGRCWSTGRSPCRPITSHYLPHTPPPHTIFERERQALKAGRQALTRAALCSLLSAPAVVSLSPCLRTSPVLHESNTLLECDDERAGQPTPTPPLSLPVPTRQATHTHYSLFALLLAAAVDSVYRLRGDRCAPFLGLGARGCLPGGLSTSTRCCAGRVLSRYSTLSIL